MKKSGILSIQPRVEQRHVTSFDNLYQTVGQNTGNLLFTNAVWSHIAGEKVKVGFTFDPDHLNDSLSCLVIPAANWLSPHVDFATLAELIARVTIPVVLIGLGAQDQSYSGSVDIPQGTRDFVQAVSERSYAISVRGAYTQHILRALGIGNVIVTGCPSLYHDFRSFDALDRPRIRVDKGLLHSTRFSASYAPFAREPSIHRALFRMAFASKMDLLLQSEREEMELIVSSDDWSLFDDRLRSLLQEIYGAPDWETLIAFVRSHARLFFDVDSWSKSLDQYDYVFGTRLHGTILALNSGVPAFLLHHDSRTEELCDYAQIPSAPASSYDLSLKSIKRSIERADYRAYYDRRAENKETYRTFLRGNGLQITNF